MEIVRIEKRNLVDEVYRQMDELITSGSWKEGDKLASEHQLCELFNVSRVVVREALQRLRTKGLIVTRRGMGSFVSNPKNFELPGGGALSVQPFRITEDEFQNFIDFRGCIEYRAIHLSVSRATAEDFTNIQNALYQMKQAVGDVPAYSEADYAFHAAIVASAHNRFFDHTMLCCKELILSCFCEMNRINDCQNWGIELHSTVAESIIRRDEKSATRALRQNDDYNLARLTQFFQGKGENMPFGPVI